jgi:hypothetical protein
MSDFINHHFCGEEAYNLLDEDIRSLIDKHRVLFNLGCQGADFFLYHGVFPWQKKSSFSYLGTLIHKSETNELFLKFVDFIKSIPDETEKEQATVYLLGFLCHHSLDSISHPFIFFYSGDNSDLHKEYEKILDVLNSKINGINPAIDFDFENITSLSDFDISLVTNIYTFLFKEIFNMEMPKNAVSASIKSYFSLINMFPDKRGIKTMLAKAAEAIIKKPYCLSKVFIKPSIKDIDDYMNLDHEEWIHPCYENLSSRESYPDLFYRSAVDTSAKIPRFLDLIDSSVSYDDIDKIIKNASFETGEIFHYENKVNTIEMNNYNPKTF